jgi:hypothetical protein
VSLWRARWGGAAHGTLFAEGVKTRLKEHLVEECNLHTIPVPVGIKLAHTDDEVRQGMA